jgi:hypothetical protein
MIVNIVLLFRSILTQVPIQDLNWLSFYIGKALVSFYSSC